MSESLTHSPMSEVLRTDDWSDYVEQDHVYDVNKVQIIIDSNAVEPLTEGDRESFFCMQDGLFLVGDDNKFHRLPVNVRSEQVKVGMLTRAIYSELPEA